MHKTILLMLTMALALPLPLLAQGGDSPLAAERAKCERKDDDGAYSYARAMLEFADRTLPMVPPEEAAAYEKEDREILELYKTRGNDPEVRRRDEELKNRPLFQAWATRMRLERLRSALAGIDRLIANPATVSAYQDVEADKLSHALAAIRQAQGYVDSVRRFVQQAIARPDRTIPDPDLARLHADTHLLTLHLADYADCKLAKLAMPAQ